MACKISSTKMRAILAASIEGKGKPSTHFVRYSVKIRTYLLPDFVVGKGPIMSQATRSKASCTGIGNNGALWRLRGVFLMAQSEQLLHQCCISLNMLRQ